MEAAMQGKKYIMGLFKNEDQVVSTLAALKETAYKFQRVHSPIPSHKIMAALDLKKSKVGWFTLAGGITGFFTGFLFAAFTATRWSMIVSGKPVVALVPFFIVGFEFTILFAVFGNVLGLISQARLPRFDTYEDYDPRFSGDRFGVLASCRAGERGGLTDLLKSQGAEIKPPDATEAEATAS
jgi:molybdopterin-containing oxidoreductase family membrane subunit